MPPVSPSPGTYNTSPYAQSVFFFKKPRELSAAGRALLTQLSNSIFFSSKDVTAGLQVYAGVDTWSVLACPVFSVYPRWQILEVPGNRMTKNDKERDPEVRSYFPSN